MAAAEVKGETESLAVNRVSNIWIGKDRVRYATNGSYEHVCKPQAPMLAMMSALAGG